MLSELLICPSVSQHRRTKHALGQATRPLRLLGAGGMLEPASAIQNSFIKRLPSTLYQLKKPSEKGQILLSIQHISY